MCEDRKDVMPTYQYVCNQCDTPLEAIQSFSDDALTNCPVCNADALRKVYGSVGVVFKGSGFYRNDSRGTASSVTPSATESSSSTTSTGATAKPAAKPAESSKPAAQSTPAASSSPSAS